MESFKYALLRIINGERKLNERRKYQVSAILLALVHLYLMCRFLVLDLKVLYVYNFVVVLFYTGIAIITGVISQYTYIFIASFIEIMLHSVLATLMLGWDWGFMTYVLGLVPLSFYITYTVDYFKRKLSIPVIASALIFACFLGVRWLCYINGPLLENNFGEMVAKRSYMFNIMLTFILLWIVSFLFSLEVYYMQHNLENENSSLEKLANFDPLTHLLNRRSMDIYLEESCYRAVKKQESFCLIMADIDDFKKINDTYGHAAGDKVLLEVSNIITGEVRDNDHVCRWGGEEILILLKSDIDSARGVAERICRNISDRDIDIGEAMIRATMTLGIAQYRIGETIEDTVERADKCMYDGKILGKNRVVVATGVAKEPVPMAPHGPLPPHG